MPPRRGGWHAAGVTGGVVRVRRISARQISCTRRERPMTRSVRFQQIFAGVTRKRPYGLCTAVWLCRFSLPPPRLHRATSLGRGRNMRANTVRPYEVRFTFGLCEIRPCSGRRVGDPYGLVRCFISCGAKAKHWKAPPAFPSGFFRRAHFGAIRPLRGRRQPVLWQCPSLPKCRSARFFAAVRTRLSPF